MRRSTVGILAVVLLALGLALELAPVTDTGVVQFAGGCWRVGTIMAVLWLAQPQLVRLPLWLFPVILVGLLLLLKWPRLILPAAAVALALLFLRPRPKRA